MTLQLLVENAVKHNVVPERCRYGYVIKAENDIAVTNNFQPKEEQERNRDWIEKYYEPL